MNPGYAKTSTHGASNGPRNDVVDHILCLCQSQADYKVHTLITDLFKVFLKADGNI